MKYVPELESLEGKVVPAAPLQEPTGSLLVEHRTTQVEEHVMQIIDTPIHEDAIVSTKGHAAENVSNEPENVEEIEGLLYIVTKHGDKMTIEFGNLPEGTNLRYQLNGKEMHMPVAGHMTMQMDAESPVFITIPGRKEQQLNTKKGVHGKVEVEGEDEGDEQDADGQGEGGEEGKEPKEGEENESAKIALENQQTAAEGAAHAFEAANQQREIENRIWEINYNHRLEEQQEIQHLTDEWWATFGWRHNHHDHREGDSHSHQEHQAHPANRNEGTTTAPRYANPDVEIPSHSSPHIIASARNEEMPKPEEEKMMETDVTMEEVTGTSSWQKAGTAVAAMFAGIAGIFGRKSKQKTRK